MTTVRRCDSTHRAYAVDRAANLCYTQYMTTAAQPLDPEAVKVLITETKAAILDILASDKPLTDEEEGELEVLEDDLYCLEQVLSCK